MKERHVEIVRDALEELLLDIVHDNSDFVCTRCLRTIRTLEKVLYLVDEKVGEETIEKVNRILNE